MLRALCLVPRALLCISLLIGAACVLCSLFCSVTAPGFMSDSLGLSRTTDNYMYTDTHIRLSHNKKCFL